MAEHYGLKLNKHDRAKCPFCGGNRKDAFKAYKETNSFHCFKCGKSGNIFEFVKNLFNISFGEAADKIRADFGLKNSSALQARPAQNKQNKEEEEREFLYELWQVAFNYSSKIYVCPEPIELYLIHNAPYFEYLTDLVDCGGLAGDELSELVYKIRLEIDEWKNKKKRRKAEPGSTDVRNTQLKIRVTTLEKNMIQDKAKDLEKSVTQLIVDAVEDY